MDDIDIWRTAHLLLKQHGPNAGEVAAAKFIDRKNAGDGEGMTVWVQVMLAIRQLTKDVPTGNESVH